MSTPNTQQPTMPRQHDSRRLPTAWFLASVVERGFEHRGMPVNGHVYVSRNEDGWYRVLCRGVAVLVSEGVARRHFRRVAGQDGAPVRVGRQEHWFDLWNESYAESQRANVA